MNAFEGVAPILNVKNLPASIDYYVNKLGFAKRWDWGDPSTFGCVARDKGSIFFCEGNQGQPGTWIMIFLDHVDQLCGEYRQRRAKVLKAPTNMPRETREMNVEDPDRHRIRLGSDSTGPADPAQVGRYWDELQFPDR